MKILFVEDDQAIALGLVYSLEKEGYEVIHCVSQKAALGFLEAQVFDLLLLDVSLPDGDGYTICKQAKHLHDVPVIFLTALDDEVNVVMSLDLGGDDYVTKPFSPRELLARVNAHMKRQSKRMEKDLEIGELRINLKRREALLKDELLTLTKKEFDLLEYFVSNKNIVLSRDAILNDIWGFDYDGDTRIVDVHVFKLRTKLQGSNVHIKSSRGVGYLLEELHETA